MGTMGDDGTGCMKKTILTFLLMFPILGPPTCFGQKARLQFTGPTNSENVVAKTGETWFGLFETEDGFEILTTRVSVFDSSSEGGMDFSMVETDQPHKPIFLWQGIKGIKKGRVKTLFRGMMSLAPSHGVNFIYEPRSEFYNIYARGEKDGETIHDYAIHVSFGGISQSLVTSRGWATDAIPKLMWAGDLDRDGKPDLLIDLAGHYNVSEPTLFLSSRVEKGKLLKKVASCRGVGC